MPESYGKRQKDTKKAKKFAAREERRALRKRQRENPAAFASDDASPDAAGDDAVDPEAAVSPDSVTEQGESGSAQQPG